MKQLYENKLGHKLNLLINKNGMHEFLIYKYKTSDKDNWSILVSACQWIQVTENKLKEEWNFSDNVDEKIIDLFSYISAISTMWDAIKELHKLCFNTSVWPFKHETSSFKNKCELLEHEDDNDYFSSIRACFGAHTVNLNFKLKDSSSRAKFVASWPFDGHNFLFSVNSDLRVQLWPVDNHPLIEKDIYNMSFHSKELNDFIKQRYEYISVIMDELKKQYEDYLNEMRGEINIESDLDAIRKIDLLIHESEKRMNYYMDDLIFLKYLFEIEIGDIGMTNYSIIDKYRSHCLKAIDLIKHDFENFNYDYHNEELEYILYPSITEIKNLAEVGYSYGREKLSSAAMDIIYAHDYESESHSLRDLLDFHSCIQPNDIHSDADLYCCVVASEFLFNSK